MPDSIANNLSADAASLQLNRHQAKLGQYAKELSSGLRIQDAQDDPSGLTISENLQIHADAFSQASQNVLNARNATTVADGALSTVTSILLRIRAIAVEASSTISSDSDRENLQQEINGLLLEVNRISQNTNFNGETLLDGSHSGFQAAQSSTITVTSNSVLASAGPGALPSAKSGLLVANAVGTVEALQPTLAFHANQAIVGSPSPQTIAVSDAQYLSAGDVFAVNGTTITVQSVNVAAGTITAVFPANIANGDIFASFINTTTTTAVAAGTHLVTLSGAQQPLYAGQVLQVDYGSFATNDVVIVQKVVSPNSFIATFTKPHAANAAVYYGNETFIGANFGPGNFTFSFGGSPTDGAPIGSTAYVIETPSGAIPPANGSATQIVATGTVIGGSASSETINFPTQIPNHFGGNFQVWTQVGLGSTPIVNTLDGTIKLQVVNTGVSIAAQESFYNTATQTETVSPYLLAPGETAQLFDGVSTTLGYFTSADVGLTAYIKVQQDTPAVTAPLAPAFTVLSGADEGETISLGIPSVSTASLRISTLTVMGCTATGTDPTLASEDTIGQCDFALDEVLKIRANLGASVIRLSTDATNDDQAKVALTASGSSIRDAHIGQAETGFTREDTAVQIGLSVLQQANQLPEQVLKLFR